ncbi:hypothetical protein D3C80_1634040 [compost metagenome]
MTTVLGIAVLRVVEQVAVRGNWEVGEFVEAVARITENLAIASVVFQVDHHQADGRYDFFAPDEQIQLVGDFVIVGAVGVAQALLDTFQALPAVIILVEVDVLIDFAGAVAVKVANANQLSGRCV